MGRWALSLRLSHSKIWILETGASAAESATAVAAAESTAASAFAWSHWASFVDGHCTAVIVSAVELGDCVQSFSFGRHFNKSEAFAAAGVTVGDDLCRLNRAALSERVIENLVGCREWQIANV